MLIEFRDRPARVSRVRRSRRAPRAVTRSVVTGCVGLLAAGLITAGTAEASPDVSASSTAVIWWNDIAGQAARAACMSPGNDPLNESRMYAMAHLAVHDALNAISRRAQSYATPFQVSPNASPDAAVAAAAGGVLFAVLNGLPTDTSTSPYTTQCIADGTTVVADAYRAALAQIPDGAAESDGVAAGKQAADAILALRSADGTPSTLFDSSYPQGTTPGVWRFTPDRPFAYAPTWGTVKPFALRSASQFAVGAPLPVTSARYAADYNEIKNLGGDGVTTPTQRTPAQTETALFWVESSPLAWNRIGRTLATSAHLDLWEQARLFGLLNMAMADGYIGSWKVKYHFNFWRPVTAIHEGESDGNASTVGDPTWTPLVTTPPIPDFDSAHAVEGAAAAAVFTVFFRTDRFNFANCSYTVATDTCGSGSPVVHTFSRFSQAAYENAVSRIYVGFHFRYAAQVGLLHGAAVGTWTALTKLRR